MVSKIKEDMTMTYKVSIYTKYGFYKGTFEVEAKSEREAKLRAKRRHTYSPKDFDAVIEK
jgi:hypothetical protein